MKGALILNQKEIGKFIAELRKERTNSSPVRGFYFTIYI